MGGSDESVLDSSKVRVLATHRIYADSILSVTNILESSFQTKKFITSL